MTCNSANYIYMCLLCFFLQFLTHVLLVLLDVNKDVLIDQVDLVVTVTLVTLSSLTENLALEVPDHVHYK